MPDTLAALLLAHVLADFVFQSGWMVANKRRAKGLAAHGAVVLACAVATTGQITLSLLWLTALHLAVDAVKARTGCPSASGPRGCRYSVSHTVSAPKGASSAQYSAGAATGGR